MERSDIFCVQAFPRMGFYDVTFTLEDGLCTCFARSQEKADNPLLEGASFIVAKTRQRTPVTVHMYNPFVRDEEIQAFLKRYCSYVSFGERIKNCIGTQRKFWVEFLPDRTGVGGVANPPQAFSIGSNRGYMFYPGQPCFCHSCFAFGHMREECSIGPVWRNCYDPDHKTAKCPRARKCHYCGDDSHLAQQCPNAPPAPCKSYAGALSGQDLVELYVAGEELKDAPILDNIMEGIPMDFLVVEEKVSSGGPSAGVAPAAEVPSAAPSAGAPGASAAISAEIPSVPPVSASAALSARASAVAQAAVPAKPSAGPSAKLAAKSPAAAVVPAKLAAKSSAAVVGPEC